MILSGKPRSFGEIFTAAWDALREHTGPILLPFAIVHAAEALPDMAWTAGRQWLGERADAGQLQSTIFGAFAHPAQLFLVLMAVFALLLVIVVAYSYAFAKVIAYLRGDAPNYRGATASLGWFGLAMLLPYAFAAAGVAVVAVPLLRGSGWEWSMVLPMFASFVAALIVGVLAQPLFFAGVAAAVDNNTYGLAALRQVMERIRKRVGQYLALALVLVAVGIGLSLIHRFLNKVLPSEPAGDVSQLLNGGLSVEAVYKAIFQPDNRPLWSSVAAVVFDVGIATVRDAYFTLVVVYWYLRKD